MLRISLVNLFRHKLRTFLSVLGIVIGVASLIVLVSVVDGIRVDIEGALGQAQGARVVPLNATDPVYTSLDEEWVQKIERVQGVKVALPNIIQIAKSIEGKKVSFDSGTRIVGIDIAKEAAASSSGFDGTLLSGRDFVSNDSGNKVALVGEQLADDLDKFVGSKIEVNDESLRVVGIFTTGSALLDNTVLMPIDVARDITDFDSGKVSFLNVVLVNPADDKDVVDRINLIYGEEIRASSLSDFSNQFGEIIGSITLLVGIIASIASVVAAVGIVNTMLMSVLERFKEIGALKAVGWTNDNIMKMIIYESVFIGVIGGILGVLLGILLSYVVEAFGLSSFITPFLLAGSFFGAVFVGLLGGIYPAFIASRMDPIEALRAE